MAGYSGTPLWKKLGYKSGMRAFVADAPRNHRTALGLPDDIPVTWLRQPEPETAFAHLFVKSAADLRAKLGQWRPRLKSDGMLWVSWPKKSSGVATDVTEDTIRDIALPLGFVDVKVCAVDEIWSGLKLVIRKSERT